ncbi:MAG: YlcI/YnfO family protein [Archangium sp.]|nr:YlcI/YnfO family protein [Archangium sp.]
MKTATFPPLRVEPKLRKSVERLLEPGETLSTFVERAVRESVDRRTSDAEFGARALASREESRRSGRYHSAASVLRDLKAQTRAARKRQDKRK